MEQHADDPNHGRLAAFVGEWSMEFEDDPPADTGARVVFEWMPGKRFLSERWEVPALDPLELPAAGIAVIGADPKSKGNFLRRSPRWPRASADRRCCCCDWERPAPAEEAPAAEAPAQAAPAREHASA